MSFPQASLRIVAPFAPGGATDFVARLMAGELARVLQKPVTVQNEPGAGGTRGAAIAAHAAPDGLTLVMGTSSTHGICTAVFESVPYDPLRDFAPVALVATAPNVLVVGADCHYRDVESIARAARAAPGVLTYGSAGYGQTIHVCGALFAELAGVELTHVPQAGSADALERLCAGEITMMFDSVLSALPYIRAGRLRALALTAARRIPELPDVPALAEIGFPGYDLTVWLGLLCPAGTPRQTIALLNTQINAILRAPEIRGNLAMLGARTEPQSATAFAQLIEANAAQWHAAVALARVARR